MFADKKSNLRQQELPSSDELKLTTSDGKKYEIPLEGSLGLLATGYQGIMAWRAKRKTHLEKKGFLKNKQQL